MAAILAALAFGTVQQSGQWASNLALFERGHGRHDANYLLGRCYHQLSEYRETGQYLSRAIERASLEAAPHMYLGLSEMKLGRLDTAEIEVRRAIELKSRAESRDFYLALGMVLAAKGDSQGAMQIRQLRAR